MAKLIFHTTQLSERGTEVALYNYAHFNEELLGNESVILFDETSPLNNAEVIRKFEGRFPVVAYRNGEDIDRPVAAQGADLLYFIKLDRNNFRLSAVAPTAVHEVFPVKPSMFHGSAYAFVSDWLSKTFSNGRIPAVPHIITLPEAEGDLRVELGIPTEATVFGCYGGRECFDILFAQQVVEEVARERADIHFIFMNIDAFARHPRLHFLRGSANMKRKVRFINSSDAMLHARRRGETFGLAIAEFSIRNKPVLTWSLSGERNHIDVLGGRGLFYKGPRGLRRLIAGFDRAAMAASDWDCYSAAYSPAAVMARFDKYLIRKALATGIGDADWSLTQDDRLAVLGHRARIRAIKSRRSLSTLLA